MNKFLAMLFTFFPLLALADNNSISFAPPASDYSVVFLADIFGVVDGVLHGTGSQIMGNMFGVFNAAVLALGGIIIMYTLLVGTMNTAHQGEMLGQKWSSIWVPVRATMGLALLIPKASGYCLMQIFVMWVVVQGVGAADKVWNAALGYLNRGGVIVQAQMSPVPTGGGGGAATEIPIGAQVILAGQVCMIALQNQLQNQLQTYQAQKQNKTGPCAGPQSTPPTPIENFCNSTVPNFVNSVNVIDVQSSHPDQDKLEVTFPNFDSSSVYAFLNGICGKLTWNIIPASDMQQVQTNIPAVQAADLDTATKSRVIAIQQMYLDLTNVAQVLVNNDPALGNKTSNQNTVTTTFSPMAVQQYGVPQTASGVICANSTTPNCILWGNATDSTGSPLLNGTEFPGAIQDYNAIMLPTLNLIRQAQAVQTGQNARAFIDSATTEGWIMAGSYFFNLVNLNIQGNSGNGANLTDSNTGLQRSKFSSSLLTQPFSVGTRADCKGVYAQLCTWFNKEVTQVAPIRSLIDGAGSSVINPAIPMPDFKSSTTRNVIDGKGSATVFGYTNNSTILQLPGQPGLQPLAFANHTPPTIPTSPYFLSYQSFSCQLGAIGIFPLCMGFLFGELFYNGIFVTLYNIFAAMMAPLIDGLINMFLMVPLQGMSQIFKYGLSLISTPGVSPIVALAQMGTFYINFVSNFWIQLLSMAIGFALIPIFGTFIFALMTMAMPLLVAWLGIMLQVGFITAYYVPILPYMIFTFGSIAWVMAVIEAMVAAPIVALGVTHPEGEGAFGKGEQAIMILMNVFLRPAMMIIGYIAAIALTYVSVWIINAGFDNAIGFIQGNTQLPATYTSIPIMGMSTSITGGYTSWAGTYAYFFSIIIYTMLYLTVVQKSFTLISTLPDKILRWIGGQAESYGQETAQWGQEVQGKVTEAGKDTAAGQAQASKGAQAQITAGIAKAQKAITGSGGGEAGAEGGAGDAGGGAPPMPPIPPV